MMPGMDGFETATFIRQRDRSRHTPIIFLTALGKSEEHLFRGYDVGADRYMTKPFELPELLAQVKSLLTRHAQLRGTATARPAGDVYEFNGAVVNFTTHEVQVRGAPQSLTPLEIKLVKYFADNDGVVLTRNQILDSVWGTDSSPTTRTVDNFIARLRQHFEADPANPRHFLSVRGVGYRFVAQPAGRGEADPADSGETQP